MLAGFYAGEGEIRDRLLSFDFASKVVHK